MYCVLAYDNDVIVTAAEHHEQLSSLLIHCQQSDIVYHITVTASHHELLK